MLSDIFYFCATIFCLITVLCGGWLIYDLVQTHLPVAMVSRSALALCAAAGLTFMFTILGKATEY